MDTRHAFAAASSGDVAALAAALDRGVPVYAMNSRRESLLQVATVAGHFGVVELLLARGANVATLFIVEGMTPLHYAVYHRHRAIAELLLRHGADPGCRHARFGSILHSAVANNDIGMVRLLLDNGASTRFEDDTGTSPLHLAAAQQEGFELAKVLVDHGADVQADAGEDWPVRPLHEAARHGAVDTARLLLERGATLCGFELCFAAEGGSLDVVKLIVEAGAPLEEMHIDKRTPLLLAAEEGYADVIEYLLARGANVLAVDAENINAMHLVSRRGSVSAVEVILRHPQAAAIINEKSLSTWTPLAYAAMFGHADVIRALLKHPSTDPTVLDRKKMTPLHDAAQRGHCSVIAVLLTDPCVDVNAKDAKGNRPLTNATKGRHVDAVKMLLQGGADILAVDDEQNTALHHCAYYDATDIVELLLSVGLSPNSRNKSGEAGLHVAANETAVGTVKALVDFPMTDLLAVDREGHTALLMLAKGGETEAVAELLSRISDLTFCGYCV